MKLLDYFFLARINLSRRRKSVFISIAFIIISLLILIISLTVSKSLSTAMNKAFLNNISYRIISVVYDKDLSEKAVKEELLEVEHVSKVLSQNEYRTGANINTIYGKEINGDIELIGADFSTCPNIIKGRAFNENEKDVCIIPKEFYPFDLQNNIESTKIINGQDLLGEYITIQYYSYDYTKTNSYKKKDLYSKTLKVVGIYDTDENMGYKNECYVLYSDIVEISKTQMMGSNFSPVKPSLIVIVDNPLNINIVLEQLNKIGIYAKVGSILNTNLLNVVNFISIMISSLLLILSFMNIVINTVKSIKERNQEISLLKAIGYKEKNILGILCIENFIIGSIGYILAIFISLILKYLYESFIIKLNYEIQQIGIAINYTAYLIAFFAAVVISVILGLLSSIKALKKQQLVIYKDN